MSSIPKNAYTKAVNHFENFGNEKSILSYTKDHPQYTYGAVTYKKFSEHYKADGWIGRKIAVLPKTVCALLKIVAAACRVLGALRTKGEPNRLKLKQFELKRNRQELYGLLASMVSDKYGQYQIQESAFHIACYASALSILESNQKLAEHLIEKGERKKALEVIKKLPKSYETSLLCKRVIQSQIDNGEKEEALKAIPQLAAGTSGKSSVLILALGCLKKKDKEFAQKMVKLLSHSGKSNEFLLSLANFYDLAENQEEALKIRQKLSLSYSKGKEESSSTVERTESYIKAEQPEKALKEANLLEIYDTERVPLLYKVAESFLKQNKLDEALKLAQDLAQHPNQSSLFDQLFAAFVEIKQLEQAENLLPKLGVDKQLDAVKKLVESYIYSKELDKALKVINTLSGHYNKIAPLCGKVIDALLEQDKRAEALAVLYSLKDHHRLSDTKECRKLLANKIAKAYCKAGEQETILQEATKHSYGRWDENNAIRLVVAQSFLDKENPEKALELINPDTPDLSDEELYPIMTRVIQLFLQQKKHDKALKFLKDFSYLRSEHAKDFNSLAIVLADFYLEKKNQRSAIIAINRIKDETTKAAKKTIFELYFPKKN